MRKTICMIGLVGLAATACKVRRSESQVRHDPKVVEESQASEAEWLALVAILDAILERGISQARLMVPESERATGFALAGDKTVPVTSTDVRTAIEKLAVALKDAEYTLQILQQLGDTSQESQELAKTVEELKAALAQKQIVLTQVEVKEAAAAERQKAGLDKLKKRRDAEVLALKGMLDGILSQAAIAAFSDCRIKIRASRRTLDLSGRKWPFGAEVVRQLVEMDIWEEEVSQYVKRDENLTLRGGKAVYLLVRYPDACRSQLVGDKRQVEFMGEARDGDGAHALFAIYDDRGRFNREPVPLNNAVVFYRLPMDHEGGARAIP